MARSLLDGWRRVQRTATARVSPRSDVRRITIVCATLIAPVLERTAAEFAALTGVETTVHPIANTFFGARVNVSGLLVAADLERQLRDRDLGDIVILPRYALDYTGNRFLGRRHPCRPAANASACRSRSLRRCARSANHQRAARITGSRRHRRQTARTGRRGSISHKWKEVRP